MTLDRLQYFNGSPVRITLDGVPALAILFFLTVDSVQITSLCFLKAGGGRCPLVRRNLTPEEIESITLVSRNELKSDIAIRSASAASETERQKRFEEEMAELQQRMHAASSTSRREMARFAGLRREAKRSVKACGEAQKSIKACQEAIRKSRRARTTKKAASR